MASERSSEQFWNSAGASVGIGASVSFRMWQSPSVNRVSAAVAAVVSGEVDAVRS